MKILRANPLLLIPALVYQIGYGLLSAGAASLSALSASPSQMPLTDLQAYFTGVLISMLTLTAFSLLVAPIVSGIYPLVVRNLIEKRSLGLLEALKESLSRYFSILAAQVLTGILVLVGSLLLLIPGLIIYTWYYYALPAIVLEKRGTLGGMSASKAFGRSRKWQTFLMIAIVELIAATGAIITALVKAVSPLLVSASAIISGMFSLLTLALTLIMASYTYIRYRPPESPAVP